MARCGLNFPAAVRVVEVGPRDGLQNESHVVPVATRAAFVEALVEAGLREVECGSFVSPKWVPQMADTAAVLSRIRRRPGVRYTVLVPNLKGLEAAREAEAADIAVFAAASECFSKHNINCSIEESLTRIRAVVKAALGDAIRVRGYVSCVLGCPYEGEIDPIAVSRVAGELSAMGCYEISLGDTIGTGTPAKTQTMIREVAKTVPLGHLAVHFHDTRGQALANILAALDSGIATVDSSAGGLGGCPYAPGASGNVATEDVVYMLDGMGVTTGVDLAKVNAAARGVLAGIGRRTNSKAALAMETGVAAQ